MPYLRRRKRSHLLWERLRGAVLVVLALAVVGGFWWWLASLGPRTVAEDDEVVAAPSRDGEVVALREQINDLVKRAMEVRPGGDADMLADAVARQNELIAKVGVAGQGEARRLQELERLTAEAFARTLFDRIDESEAAADEALAAGQTDVAAVRWQEALEWQRAINRSAAGSNIKNFVRETRLDVALLELEAAPIAAEVTTALALARDAASRDDWSSALSAYAAAREGQALLNGQYAKTKWADTMQLDRIEREISSLDASALAAEVDTQESAGVLAMTEQRYEAAADAFAQARELQLRINQEFARSRFLSSPRVELLEVKRQTAASLPRLQALRKSLQVIAMHLKRREVVSAATVIADAHGRIEALQAQLPKSEQLDARLRLRLSYLSSQAERLGEIQDTVMQRMRPLPGAQELQMLQTEVPQSLYLQIMKTNPSRHAGRAFPVDSVSWMDAIQFCERLGWIMGQTVRLPNADEFRVAVGDASVHSVPENDPADKKSQSRQMAVGEANAAGFFDLLGNLAEWLDAPQSERGSDVASVAGGSYLETADALRSLPLEERPRSDRARHIGFRFVMEIGETDEAATSP